MKVIDDLLLIEIPEDKSGLMINTRKKLVIGKKGEVVTEIDLPDGQYEILGTITKDEITFDVEPFVRKVTLGYWLDYTKQNTRHDLMRDTPIDSFRSKLASHGIEISENTKFLALKKVND